MQLNALVLGYYDRENLGDETYKLAFTKYFPEYYFTFLCVDDITNKLSTDKYNILIIGGGDIVNDYFYNKIYNVLENFKGIKLALSIGIPFTCLITDYYFKHYDHVFTRNYEDLRALQQLIGSKRAHYLPDFAFVIDKPIKFNKINTNKHCGIFLVNNLLRYPEIIDDIAKLIAQISSTYHLTFYSFNTSKSEEGDNEINNHISKLILNKYNKHACITLDSNSYSAIKMLDIMAELDFTVCMRYHAHIFSMITNIPFMSISSTKKTRSIMEHFGLADYQYQIQLDNNSNPRYSNFNEMLSIYNKSQYNYEKLKHNIIKATHKCKFLLDHKQIHNIITQYYLNINNNVAVFFDKYNTDYDNASRLINKKILGYSDSIFHWGIVDKMRQIKDSVIYSIEYLLENKLDYLMETISGDNNIPLTIDLDEYQSFKSAHRGGWYVAIEQLAKLMSTNGIYCDMYIDRTFHWCNNYMTHCGTIPYTIPWCGFIHHTLITPYSNYNTVELFKNKEFLQSLHTCVALFTLSECFTKQVKKLISETGYDIPVFTLMHPVVNPIVYFTMNNYLISNYLPNSNRKLIQIGSWLRNYFTIHTIDTSKSKLQKYVLIGKNMDDCKFPTDFKIKLLSEFVNNDKIQLSEKTCYDYKCTSNHDDVPCRGEPTNIPRIVSYFITWLINNHMIDHEIKYNTNTLFVTLKNNTTIKQIKSYTNNVKYLSYLINDDYDHMLSENIVFLHLVEVAACNVIIECIVRNTPVLVNKIPGTVELLGTDYPLFYTEHHLKNNTIGTILTNKNIRAAHHYLSKINKAKYEVEYFMKELKFISEQL